MISATLTTPTKEVQMRDMTIERHQSPRPPLPTRTEEHISITGHLKVPVPSWWDKAPEREDWEPFFVNVDLNSERNQGIEKVYIYRRIEVAA